MARKDLWTVEVAAIGYSVERLGFKNGLRLLGHVGELRPIRAAVRHLVGHNQMMLGIYGDLHIVANDAGAAAARGHRTAVGIGQRDLLVGRSKHLLLVNGKLAHFLLQLRQLLFKPRRLRGQCLRRLLPVGRVKLAQIACDALLQLGTPPFHLRPREVLVPVVHGFELAAIDGNTRRREKAHFTAEFDETRTYLA